MASLTLKSRTGDDKGDIELPENVFGIDPNVAVMHQVVTAQLAARRSGTQSTKTRAEKRGGGAKPWRQKGTGRARQGSIRSPQWRGGGVALGPKPRSYEQRTPKKMVRLALRSALSDRAAEGKVVVVEEWAFSVPRTKEAQEALEALGVQGRALVVVSPDDRETWLSFRNLPKVHVISPGELNAYDVLVNDYVVFSRDTLPAGDGIVDNRRIRAARATAREAAGLVRDAKVARRLKVGDSDAPSEIEPEPEVPSNGGDDTSGVAGGDTDEPVDLFEEVDEGEDDDMASDLPNRPKTSGDKGRTVIEPTERVKSVSDKVDPRFAAARNKVDKEDRRRAARGKKAKVDVDDTTDDVDEEEDPVEETKSGFSFNMTTQPKQD